MGTVDFIIIIIIIIIALKFVVGLWPLKSYTQLAEHLGRGISPWQGRYLHTGQQKYHT
jgi:hypothetical protein